MYNSFHEFNHLKGPFLISNQSLDLYFTRSYSNITTKSKLCVWDHEYSILCKPEMTTLSNRNEPYHAVDIL